MKFFTLLLLLLCSAPVFALQDSSAYQTQRKKINNLLQNRSDKFGQYDLSLNERTGIFGLKTKKDMQRSNDILTEIVRTDNAIFKELKILLDYKDLEKSEVEDKAVQSQGRIGNYQRTITKLQLYNERTTAELEEALQEYDGMLWMFSAAVAVCCLLAVLLYRAKKLTSL